MKGTAILIVLLNLWVTSLALNCKVVPGSLKQIDAGNGQVFGVNIHNMIYTRYVFGWTRISGALKHVTVGPAGIWGVSSDNQIYKLVNGNWVTVQGRLKQIDAGGSMFVAGASAVDEVFCLSGDSTIGYKPGSSAPWVQIPGKLKYYSCGPYSCWGVNAQENIYIMKGVNPAACGGSQKWQQVPGGLSMIEVSTDGRVYGVSYNGKVFSRDGVSQCNPAGTGWRQIPFPKNVKHVSYDLGHLWLIGTDNSITDCTI